MCVCVWGGGGGGGGGDKPFLSLIVSSSAIPQKLNGRESGSTGQNFRNADIASIPELRGQIRYLFDVLVF